MPLTPAQIKDKLTNALDDDKNVIDEKAVEEVITLLEASNITKEILEQTRIGRDINLVRKTLKNPAIAKRAKNLVKAWKQLIVPGSPQVANGQHPVQRISPGLSPASSRCSTPVKSLQSPALMQARQQQGLKAAGSQSPVVQTRGSQPPLPPSKLAQQDVKPKKGSTAKSPKFVNAVNQQQLQRTVSSVTNEDSNLSWPGTPPSNVSENSQDRLIGDRENQESSAGDKNCHCRANKKNFDFGNKLSDHSTESTSKSANRASDQRDVSKTNVANRKRTRSRYLDDSNDSFPDPPSKQPRLVSSSPSLSTFSKNDVINGSVVRKTGVSSPGLSAGDAKAMVSSASRNSLQDQPDTSSIPSGITQRLVPSRQDSVDSRLSVHSSDSRVFREKLSKVKTTEQLIEDMQRKSATPVGTKVIAQIRTNQIQKESDSQKTALPAGVKRRGRKKQARELQLPDNESASEGRRLAQAKNEYIERFLQTSVAPTPGEDAFEQPISHSRQESLEEQPIALGGCSSTFAQSAYESGFHSYSSRQDKPDSGPSASPPEARDILEGPGHLPSTSAAASVRDTNVPALDHLTEEQILARLPPIDFGNIDWTSHDYPSPQPVQVSEALLDRLHHGNLDGINGTYDRDGQFRRWHEMLTMDSIYDEPLYILPYVIPND